MDTKRNHLQEDDLISHKKPLANFTIEKKTSDDKKRLNKGKDKENFKLDKFERDAKKENIKPN